MDRADVAVTVRMGKACVITYNLSSDIFLVNVKAQRRPVSVVSIGLIAKIARLRKSLSSATRACDIEKQNVNLSRWL